MRVEPCGDVVEVVVPNVFVFSFDLESCFWCRQEKPPPFQRPLRRVSPRRELVSTHEFTSTSQKPSRQKENQSTLPRVPRRRLVWTNIRSSSTHWRPNHPWNWSKTATHLFSSLTLRPTNVKLSLPLEICTILNARRLIHLSHQEDWRSHMYDWARTTMPLMLPTELV